MKLIVTDLENFTIPVEGEYKIIKPKGNIKHCIGCFGCWIKTPGQCAIHDGYENTGIDMSKCTELIFISKCCYGSVSPFVKTVQDRAISYIHPDFVIRKGEMHHKRRYQNTISLSAHFYGENITDAEKETAKNILDANADNYDGIVKEIHIYGIVNCGFYEGIQAEYALQILQNWCSKTGYLWGGGIGVGGGGGLAQMPKTESGHGPREPIDHALALLAGKILTSDSAENSYVSVAFPRFLYKMGAQFGWRQMIRANGGKAKDLGKKP